MTVQQCNCKLRPYRPRETNEAELSESDKKDYTVEDQLGNSLLFFDVQFCEGKIHPNGLLYGAKIGFLTRKSGRASIYSILFLYLCGLQCNQFQSLRRYCLR